MKSTASNAAQINAYISSKVAEAERIALELETRSRSVTAYDIKHKILGGVPADFFEYFRAGLNKHISFHTARHSWAVRALQKGMRIEYVSRLMGHASVKNTEMYAKILDCELDKAMEIFN